MAALLAGTVFIAIVATQNFYTIDRLLDVWADAVVDEGDRPSQQLRQAVGNGA